MQSDKSNIDLLTKHILYFFEENNLNFDDISEILVNQGPGNFSGLRGSLATAKGMSLSKNLKLIGYNNFIWSCAKFFNKENYIYSIVKFRDRYFIKKFNKNLISNFKAIEVTEHDIIEKYNEEFKVIAKNAKKHFTKKILSLGNLTVVDLDHNELEFLRLKDLLDENLIRPLYLS